MPPRNKRLRYDRSIAHESLPSQRNEMLRNDRRGRLGDGGCVEADEPKTGTWELGPCGASCVHAPQRPVYTCPDAATLNAPICRSNEPTSGHARTRVSSLFAARNAGDSGSSPLIGFPTCERDVSRQPLDAPAGQSPHLGPPPTAQLIPANHSICKRSGTGEQGNCRARAVRRHDPTVDDRPVLPRASLGISETCLRLTSTMHSTSWARAWSSWLDPERSSCSAERAFWLES